MTKLMNLTTKLMNLTLNESNDDETDESNDETDESNDETDESNDETDESNDETDESNDETDESNDETDESTENISLSIELEQNTNSSNGNTIPVNINIVNSGSESISLNNLSIRYYFTEDSDENDVYPNIYADYAGGSLDSQSYQDLTSAITVSMTELSPELYLADHYGEILFDSDETLDVNGSLKINARIAKSNWSNFNFQNDHSSSEENIIAYYNNQLIHGSLPGESTGNSDTSDESNNSNESEESDESNESDDTTNHATM